MSQFQFTTNIANPIVGQIGSSAEYSLKTASISKNNIIKIVVNSPFRGEAISAYDSSLPSTFKINYNNESTSPYIVKQFDDRGYVSAWGYLLRYVPGDTIQTFYIEVQEGEFNINNGVIFNNKKAKNAVDVSGGKMFGYGSSIKELTTLTNVYKLTSVYDTTTGGGEYRYRWEAGDGSDGDSCSDGSGTYSDSVLEWDFGNFNSGNYLNLKKRDLLTTPRSCGFKYVSHNALQADDTIATGKIIAVLVGAAGSTISVVVDFNKSIDEWVYGDNLNDYYIEDINATSPCARYFVDVSEQITKGSTTVQEVTFSDDADISATTYVPTVSGSSPSNKVYQFDWRFTRQIEEGAQVYEGIDPTQSAQGIIEGSVLGWFPYTKQLYVIFSGTQFKIECGTVYQRASSSGTQYLGGKGIISISQPIKGFFLNISQPYEPAAIGSFAPSASSLVFQSLSADDNRDGSQINNIQLVKQLFNIMKQIRQIIF